MILFLLAYFGGVLTIVSPCILPVLPFVFARADRPFLRNGLPMLAGMAATFAAVATLAAVGGGWAVAANQYRPRCRDRPAGRVWRYSSGPALSDWMTRPLVALGARLARSAEPGAGRPGDPVFGVARRGDGAALGALRRSGAGSDPDRSGAGGCQRADIAAACGLCGGGGNVAGARFADRRSGVSCHEALTAGRGVDTPWSGHRGAGRGRGDCAWSGHRVAHPRFAGDHRFA